METELSYVGFVRERVGPVISQHRGTKRFSIDFSGASLDWLTSELKIVPIGTVGEANRKFLHQRLDEYIDWFIEESKHE